MKCPKCGERLYVVDSVKNEFTGETYRMRKCKNCHNVIYTVEFEVPNDETFSRIWSKFYRKHKRKGEK